VNVPSPHPRLCRDESATADPGPTDTPTFVQPERIITPPRRTRFRRLSGISIAGVLIVTVGLSLASPAFAATGSPTLTGVIDNLQNWLVGILAAVATLFLTIGGLRYLTAGGDPGQVEKAKTALKSAAIGYALAILAPLLVSILASLVGG
jgi:Type IV secretion system pilin